MNDRITELENKLAQQNLEIMALRKTINHVMRLSSKLAEGHVDTLLIPQVQCRMIMALPNDKMSKVHDVVVDHGLMIYPLSGQYRITTVGTASKTLSMLAHVMRWVTSGEHGQDFYNRMRDLQEATTSESL